MFFAGAAGFGSDLRKPPVIVRQEISLTFPPKKSIQTKSMVALGKQFDREKAQLHFEFDKAGDRQTSEYMALLDRIRSNRQRPDKIEADREAAKRIDVIRDQTRANVETFQSGLCELKKNFNEISRLLEKECVDDVLRGASGKPDGKKINSDSGKVCKAEIRACLDEMHRKIEVFILEGNAEGNGKSLEEVCRFTLEKYEEFERKVEEVKRNALLRRERENKRDEAEGETEEKGRKERMEVVWWEWAVIVSELLLSS